MPAADRVDAPVAPAPRSWRGVDRSLAGALVVGFVIRLVWCRYAGRMPTTFGDPFSYLYLAEDVATGKGYVTFYVGTPTAYYPPGYPMLLAGLLRLARVVAPGTTPLQVALALNLVCGTATIAAVYGVARRIATRRVARLAAVIAAVLPGLWLYTATAYLETVFCFLVALIAWILVGPARADAATVAPAGPGAPGARGAPIVSGATGRTPPGAPNPTSTTAGGARPGGLAVPGPGWLVVLAALFAGATMIRPITLAFVPVLLLAWGFGRPGWLRAAGGVAVLVAAVAVLAVPWSIGSSRALHGTVLLSTNTGDNLCVGHSDGSTGGYLDVNSFCGQGYDDVAPERREAERNRRGTERAIAWARAHPVEEARLLVRKTGYLLAHGHEGVDAVESYGGDAFLPEGLRTALKVVADVAYGAVGVLALAGAAWVAWKGTSRARLVLAWAAVLLAVPLLFFGGPRFHLPFLPFAAVFAAVAIDLARRRVRPVATD